MRFHSPIALSVLAALSVVSLELAAQNTSSYGPEVSAEDFTQHVAALSALSTNSQRIKYIQGQFNRLGLDAEDLHCPNPEQGLYAAIKLADNNKATAQYTAHLDDAYQTAGVLEIAERFMTQKPRPSHAVYFYFLAKPIESQAACAEIGKAHYTAQPLGMENLDASSLVRDLNTLYLEGK